MYLPNGTYTYTITTSERTYMAVPSSGPVTVDGGYATVSISWEKLYSVTIDQDSNIPVADYWYVSITASNGKIYNSGPIAEKPLTQNYYKFWLPNGTYSYKVYTYATDPAGHHFSPATGSFILNGSDITITVSLYT